MSASHQIMTQMSLTPQPQTLEKADPPGSHWAVSQPSPATPNPSSVPAPPPTILHPAMCLRLHVLTAMAGKPCLAIAPPPSFRPVPAKATKSALLSPAPSRFLSARISSMVKRPLILSSMVMMTLHTRQAQKGSAQTRKRPLFKLG